MPIQRTGTAQWVIALICAIYLLIGILIGGVAGFLAGESYGSDQDAGLVALPSPSNPLRGLPAAIEEDLGMSADQWFNESIAATAAISESLYRGILPTRISGTEIVDSTPYGRSAVHASEVMRSLPPEARSVPERTDEGAWLCSPGFDTVVVDHNRPGSPHTRAALTASHCLVDLPPSATDHPLGNVLGEQSSPTDSLFPSDTSGVENAGSDVALTSRAAAVSRMDDLQPSVGLVPMIPGMKICAHGDVSGWRCGEVLSEQRHSNEGVAYQSLAIPSASGDSGGRIIYGHFAAGVTSAYSYILGEGGRGRHITNSWAGSLFDTAVAARERGFEILIMH